MNKKHHLHHFWLILAAYGVWFAVFSGIEEIFSGKYLKVTASIISGVVIYLFIESRFKK